MTETLLDPEVQIQTKFMYLMMCVSRSDDCMSWYCIHNSSNFSLVRKNFILATLNFTIMKITRAYFHPDAINRHY